MQNNTSAQETDYLDQIVVVSLVPVGKWAVLLNRPGISHILTGPIFILVISHFTLLKIRDILEES
jgi:uncharacterized membrane protein YpjA